MIYVFNVRHRIRSAVLRMFAPASMETGGLDDVLKALGNSRRRQVMGYLQHEEAPADLDGLATHIAAIENGKDESDLTNQERKRVYIALYQVHLDRLDAINAIDYDDRGGVVTKGDRFDAAVLVRDAALAVADTDG